MLRIVSASAIFLAVVLMIGSGNAVAHGLGDLPFAITPQTIEPMEFRIAVALFVAVTLGLVVFVAVILWKIQSEATKLVSLGLVLAVAGVGYGSMGGGAMVMTPMLMKISFLLVLGGIACSVFSKIGCGNTDKGEEK